MKNFNISSVLVNIINIHHRKDFYQTFYIFYAGIIEKFDEYSRAAVLDEDNPVEQCATLCSNFDGCDQFAAAIKRPLNDYGGYSGNKTIIHLE